MREKPVYRTKIIQVKETISLYEKGDVVDFIDSNDAHHRAVVLKDQNEDEDAVVVRQISDGATNSWPAENIHWIARIGRNFVVNK